MPQQLRGALPAHTVESKPRPGHVLGNQRIRGERATPLWGWSVCVRVEGVGGQGGLKLAANRTPLAQGLCLEGVKK